MNERVADWILRNKHVTIACPINPKIKIIWRSTDKVLFDGTEEECLSWDGAEIWHVIEWTFDFENNTFTVTVI